MNINPHGARFILIFLAGISLLAGLWAGLARMGWRLPLPAPEFVLAHGPLMVVGFLGTLIGLERAVALKRWWPYGIPVFSAVAALSLLMASDPRPSAAFGILASALLIAVFVALYRQYPSEHFIIMALSAAAWLVGNILWLAGAAIFMVVPWWVGFLVLMIAGERLELSRLRRPPPLVRVTFHLSILIILAGLAYSYIDMFSAVRLAGFGLFAVALWLLRYDLVWHSARQPGLPRFMSVCLIAGYLWLAAAGIFWIGLARFFSAGPAYDAMLHAIFLGFVFSMIFAHGPIILPTITGLALPFDRAFYIHAGLLHASLLLRVTGDLGTVLPLQQWNGLLNALAILLFLVNNVRAVRRGMKFRRMG
jgi:hypothetical protein